MRRTWPYYLAVAVVGGLAGLAVAGRPPASDPFIIDTSTVTTTTGTDAVQAPISVDVPSDDTAPL